MLKDNKEKLQELNDEILNDDKLEQVAGGQIELDVDELSNSTEEKKDINGISGNGGGHWA